jgi:hypothetical protein
MRNKLSIDELFQEQSKNHFLATVEPIEDSKDLVKVTPWLKGEGCLCGYTFNIEKDKIESVEPTGDKHYCCDKSLLVVEITFKEKATITFNHLFQTLLGNIKKKHSEHHHMQPQHYYPQHEQFQHAQLYHNQQLSNETYVNLNCPPGSMPISCGGATFCASVGSSCCNGMICSPGQSCLSCGGGFTCAQRGSTCCTGGVICPPGRSCVPTPGGWVCR